MTRYRVTFAFAPEAVVAPTLETLDGQDAEASPAATLFDDRADHLHERAWIAQDEGTVHARYEFDEVYARAHPESLDREHLELLHGTLAAKILDEGAIVLDRAGLAATLRWPALARKGTRLGRDGSRRRGM